MALYLGDRQVKINLGGQAFIIKQLQTDAPGFNKIRLVSLDNCILKDVNGVYLTIRKENEQV